PVEQLDQVIKLLERLKGQHTGDDEIFIVQLDEPESDDTTVPRELVPSEEDDGGFMAYDEAELDYPLGAEPELHETPLNVLVDLVKEAVRQEGPLHVSMVTLRIREAWGLKRT